MKEVLLWQIMYIKGYSNKDYSGDFNEKDM